MYRQRVGYPELKRAVRELAHAYRTTTVLIEDQQSGTRIVCAAPTSSYLPRVDVAGVDE